MTDIENQSYHYGVVRRAIEIIDRHHALGQAPSLDALAAALDMSPTHLQRTFTRWAGVSPKKYAQFLALSHAKTLLGTRHTTLQTAQITGLSGTGRLHDLFLRWEAMSPGSYGRGGAGLRIAYGWFESAFGPALVMGTERGICGIGFAAEQGRDAVIMDLKGRWPHADFYPDETSIRPWAEAALGQGSGEARLSLIGSPLQIKVWEALLHVPDGHVTTYSDIAKAIGNPGAVRAVGTAVGRNPIGLLIPCHRALRKSGALGGYHWGLPVKRAMLAWESAKHPLNQRYQ